MAGPIQSDINQALGTLGVLATLSPQLKEHAENMAENRKLDKRLEVLNKQSQVANQDLQKKFTPDAEGNIIIDPQTESELWQSGREVMRQNQELEDIARRRYDLKPTSRNYQSWLLAASTNQNMRDEFADNLRDDYANLEKQQQAMDKVGRLQEAKKTQKRNFMTYLAQQPTSLGGTVGDLSPELQKKIAAQYSEKDRKRIMNQMDREAANGKQQ